jgi:broad specificity phosphatase PhoE
MRILEIMRHAPTKKGPTRGRGSHLSAEGVALARALGDRIGPISYVLTSAVPRAIETAVAMGFAVDDTVTVPAGYLPNQIEHHAQWTWSAPYARYAQWLGRSPELAAVAAEHRSHWLRAVLAVEDGETALVVSHGGIIEPTLVSCRPQDDLSAWGLPFAPCDGARLVFDEGAWQSVEFLRVKTPAPGDLAA